MFAKDGYKYKDNTIENMMHVLMCISSNMYTAPIVGVGYKGVFLQGHEALTSAINSLEVMDFCVSNGYFSDAYSVLRKIRDDLFQELFILINLKDHAIDKNGYDNDETQRISNLTGATYKALSPEEKQRAATYAVEVWTYNDLTDEKNESIKSLFFDYKKYISFIIESNENIEILYKQYFKKTLQQLSRKLNNYVHGNGYKYLHNNFGVLDKNKFKEEFLSDFIYIFKIYISFLALIDSFALRSSDYFDAIEMGFEPEPGSIYWVAPVIQEFMIENLDKPILEFLQEHQNGEMDLVGE